MAAKRRKRHKEEQRAGFLRLLCLFVAKCSAPVLSPRVLAPDLGASVKLQTAGGYRLQRATSEMLPARNAGSARRGPALLIEPRSLHLEA
jgi:hypothetical protein